MKLLSVVIPCYNSQDYMRKCIDSLLPGGEDVELLIVNDGSRDETAEIADEYETRYPTIVKAIHQENKGHGGAVNTGIHHASGLYLKVVDSDDWVDYEAYMNILQKIKSIVSENQTVDLILSNFVFEKEGKKYKKVMKYENVFPQDTIFSWDDVGNFRKGQYIMMHSMIYRRELLKDCGLKLPEHTFYVDNIFVFHPLKYVKKMLYLNENFYRYFIGRDDQSVNEKVMIKRIDQQLKVNKMMVDRFDMNEIDHPKLRQYLTNHLEIVTIISAIMLIRSGTEENLRKKEELWKYIEENNPEFYQSLKYGTLGKMMNLPGRIGRTITIGIYKISQKIVGFN
ncbi:glycosyltransferase family 2 protein [Fervidibacillus halotolerans]|uniref:Glycosyltransferase n=1 Tax=Fervidibacillus halotolerans TaxID=2980027 RepID=A0A9E8LZK5_9BACI|nr:glycosyltransferase family 2 protein [Fervidibacillus halotolerans]WAA12713.1 glycosyltransferase [Fervidibacillus halotolerans]